VSQEFGHPPLTLVLLPYPTATTKQLGKESGPSTLSGSKHVSQPQHLVITVARRGVEESLAWHLIRAEVGKEG